MNRTTLRLIWVFTLVSTALIAFALGMLLVMIEFQLADYMRSLSPALWVPIVFGTGAYAGWLSYLAKRILAR